MLVLHGLGEQREDWGVNEINPPGFSRIYYIYGGNISYHTEEGTQPLSVGNLYVFPSSIPFKISHEKGERLSCLWLHIDFFPVMINKLYSLPVMEQSPIWNHIQLLWDCIENGKDNSSYFHLLVEAFTLFLSAELSLQTHSVEVSKIVYDMREFFSNPNLSISNIANDLGYSTEHFIRLFREEMNSTPYQYLLNLRMAKACTLLLEGNPVKTVGEAVGYADPKTFANAFKHKYGISPSKYRNFYRAIP